MADSNVKFSITINRAQVRAAVERLDPERLARLADEALQESATRQIQSVKDKLPPPYREPGSGLRDQVKVIGEGGQGLNRWIQIGVDPSQKGYYGQAVVQEYHWPVGTMPNKDALEEWAQKTLHVKGLGFILAKQISEVGFVSSPNWPNGWEAFHRTGIESRSAVRDIFSRKFEGI